jgi:hypothetical protein
MRKPIETNDRDARRAQALRANLRRRKAGPEPVRDQNDPPSGEGAAQVQPSSDIISRP